MCDAIEIKFTIIIQVLKWPSSLCTQRETLYLDRGVPIIRPAKLSATDIGISTELQEDRHCYRYLYSSNSL